MSFNRKFLILLMFFVCIMSLSFSSAYTGTGFTHNVPDNYYDTMSAHDILGKYNNTYLTSEERAVCTKVVDGDTIYLSNGKKVRFVGVNTPEKGVTGYYASKRFVEKLCYNKEVGINIDDKKHNDKYGRTLAVVIVDGKNLNEMLLKEGLAEVMYMPPSEFYPYSWTGNSTQASHATTVSTSSGVTSSSGSSISSSSDSSASYIGNLNSHKFHKSSCDEVKKMSSNNKVYFKTRSEATSQGYVGCKKCNP